MWTILPNGIISPLAGGIVFKEKKRFQAEKANQE